MRNGRAVRIFLAAAAVVPATVIMTLPSADPPLCYLYDWTRSNHMSFVWTGAEAGDMALCLPLYLKRNK